MAKRKAAPVRAASASTRDLHDVLAVTGDAPDTLRMLIALCDQIIARRKVLTEIDTAPLSGT